MDYTLSDHYVIDVTTGHRRHDLAGAIPTQISDKDFSSIIWSLMEIVNAAGRAPQQFDPTTPATYQVLLNSLADLFGAGRLIGIQVFNASGVYTPTPGTKSVIVEACGGGGGGGGTASAGGGLYSISQSAGGGSYGRGRYTAGFSGVTVTIGAGGTGGAGGGALGSTGGNGGTTSFGALLSCPGGFGANVQAGQATPSTNTSISAMPGGGLPSGANLLALAGGQAGVSWQSGAGLGMRGKSGGSYFGPGAGENQNSNAPATTPLNPGEGGTGGFSYNGLGAYAGSDGKKGIVIVYEFA